MTDKDYAKTDSLQQLITEAEDHNELLALIYGAMASCTMLGKDMPFGLVNEVVEGIKAFRKKQND